MAPGLSRRAVLVLAALPVVAAAPEDRNDAFWTFLSLMIVLMVLGMAATVDKAQARTAMKAWKAPLLGIFSQCIFMPFLAYVLGEIFSMTPTERIGLILVGCTPGGTTSQLFTYWSAGNVALSFLMTICSTTLALGWIPALIEIAVKPYISNFNSDTRDICQQLLVSKDYMQQATGQPVLAAAADVATISAARPKAYTGDLPKYCWDTQLTGSEWKCAQAYTACGSPAVAANITCYRDSVDICVKPIESKTGEVVRTLLVIVVCATIGYFSREPWFGHSKLSKYHNLRKAVIRNVNPWISLVGNFCGVFVVLVLIAWGSIEFSWIYTHATYKTWLTCIFIGMGGFLFGYGTSRAFGFSIRDARTISLETGIQNGPLAIIIVQSAMPACSKGQPFALCARDQALLFPYIYSVFIVLQSVLVTTQIYMKQRVEPVPVLPKLKSKVADGEQEDDGGAPRRSLFGDGTKELTIADDAGAGKNLKSGGGGDKAASATLTTLYDTFQRGARLYKNAPCLGTRQPSGLYEWLTYGQVEEMASALGAGLQHACGAKSGDFLGIMSINRAEWIVAAEASHAYNLVKVPLYDTLGEEAIRHIINQTGLKVVVCAPNVQKTLQGLKGECPSLEHIVVMPAAPMCAPKPSAGKSAVTALEDLAGELDDMKGKGAAASVACHGWEAVLAAGRAQPVPHAPPATSDALAMLCYTSGTTGLPKGAMLSHGNVVANIAGSAVVDAGMRAKGERPLFFGPDDVHISYLPLAHIFEQFVVGSLLCAGGRAGFFSGSIPTLMEDICELRPTVFVSVPRLLNRLHDKVMARVEAQTGCVGDTCGTACPPPKLGRFLFKKGYAAKKRLLPEPAVEDGFWDSTVFGGVARRLGGNVRLILTGSAPISADVLDFLRVCFSCDVVEGYGQTESAAAITAAYPRDTSTGNCGVPHPSNQVKLVSVPEMDYLTSDSPCPRGEVCCKGANVFLGYYKDEEKTREAIDADGWLHTGDIGQWNPDGTLKIIDRKKNIFKLAQGEYVAPEKLEGVAQSSPLIAQAFIYGDSLKHQLVSVVVPDHEALKDWARGQGLDGLQAGPGVDAEGVVAPWYAALAALPEVKTAIMDELVDTAKAAGLKGFEKAKECHVEPRPFDAERGLLTPTFKPKRPQLRKHYQAQIDAMYEALG
eukprot:g1637.t1